MGNCQAAADVASTVVIEHPDGRVDKAHHRSLTASQVMASNPGHYVTAIVTARSKAPPPPPPTSSSSSSSTTTTKPPPPPPPPPPVRYLKLLPPDDALLVGHVYRLVTFEDVLREFGSKKHVRLSRLLAKHKQEERHCDRGEARGRRGGQLGEESSNSTAVLLVEEEQENEQGGGGGEETHGTEDVMESLGNNNGMLKQRSQWRPSLHTIDEVGN